MSKSPDPSNLVVQIHKLVDTVARLENILSDSSGQHSQNISAEIATLKEELSILDKISVDTASEISELRALATVGKVINSSLHPTTVLNEVMDTIIALMEAERGFLMLRDDQGELDVRVARNIDRESLNETEIEVSRTVVSRVAASAEAVVTTNAQEDPRFDLSASIQNYQLRSIICVPLKLKGTVTGVIYVDSRLHSNLFTERDRDLLDAFSDQAAIAIENAQLFEGLQRSKAELVLAYDATLEGWAMALELRDKETEGHTRRVTDLTVELARSLGVQGDDLIHIKRGAILHDIGKIGIPDKILHKPGPLLEAEWRIMRRHPDYANEMLSYIPYLYPALDIPYCHHEKWDGSGYPRGLKSEQIPLSARAFAIIDVWDALSSDRVYRKAWPTEKVNNFIRGQSGKHFDPQVTKVFFEIIREDHKLPVR
jgi:HD-GYP domain-containing protein (c-di-GMP phosphodiesterase class II)